MMRVGASDRSDAIVSTVHKVARNSQSVTTAAISNSARTFNFKIEIDSLSRSLQSIIITIAHPCTLSEKARLAKLPKKMSMLVDMPAHASI
jgi:hypothetical protein